MSYTTKIEWCDHTFNPWIGCTRVSPACDHCYAADMARRYGWAEWGAGLPRHRTSAANWLKPLAWDRAAAAAGVRKRVFCASLADVFDAEVSDDWRAELFAHVILPTPHLDWLLLTKRPQVAKKWFAAHPAPANVWLGTTVEDQKMADLRIPILLSIDVKVRFLSCEPLLGPISFRWARWQPWAKSGVTDHLDGLRRLSWIIVGGESGREARSMHPAWAREIRDQCAEAGVPFFFKQWGEWAPSTEEAARGNPRSGWQALRGHPCVAKVHELYPDNGAAFVAHVGKKAAGALLDGKLHREFPT